MPTLEHSIVSSPYYRSSYDNSFLLDHSCIIFPTNTDNTLFGVIFQGEHSGYHYRVLKVSNECITVHEYTTHIDTHQLCAGKHLPNESAYDYIDYIGNEPLSRSCGSDVTTLSADAYDDPGSQSPNSSLVTS